MEDLHRSFLLIEAPGLTSRRAKGGTYLGSAFDGLTDTDYWPRAAAGYVGFLVPTGVANAVEPRVVRRERGTTGATDWIEAVRG